MTIEEIFEKFKDDSWNNRDDAWKSSQEVKDLITKMLDETEMPVQVKEELKRKLQQL